jgi:hypothetical protein
MIASRRLPEIPFWACQVGCHRGSHPSENSSDTKAKARDLRPLLKKGYMVEIKEGFIHMPVTVYYPGHCDCCQSVEAHPEAAVTAENDVKDFALYKRDSEAAAWPPRRESGRRGPGTGVARCQSATVTQSGSVCEARATQGKFRLN